MGIIFGCYQIIILITSNLKIIQSSKIVYEPSIIDVNCNTKIVVDSGSDSEVVKLKFKTQIFGFAFLNSKAKSQYYNTSFWKLIVFFY